MDSFTAMLSAGMRDRGHDVQIWNPKPGLFKLAIGDRTRKWLGYLDQFVLFPASIRLQIRRCRRDTLFVFTDQALGPWIPIVKEKRHVVHCHDFLALQSAQGLIPENKTRWSGKIYQEYIRRGFTTGRNFISVSKRTSEQLRNLHPELSIRNEVVYNGLNTAYCPVDQQTARNYVFNETNIETSGGYILHVGGNQWYKNKRGVLEIYNAWRKVSQRTLPLLLVGQPPTSALRAQAEESEYVNDIHFISGKDDLFIKHAYSGACLLLFPSLAEGFGWPIAEAMACGCPVITTNITPMTEVGADSAFYIDRRPPGGREVLFWAYHAADLLETIVNAPEQTLQSLIEAGLENAKRFSLDATLDKIEKIYLEVK